MYTAKVKTANFIYLLIFLSPFTVYSISIGSAGLSPISLCALFLFFIFIILCMSRRSIPNITILGPLHLLYILVAMISIVFADVKKPGIIGSGAYFVKLFLCFLLPVVFLRTRDEVEKAVYVFIFAGFLNAIMGWVELIGYYFFHQVIFPPFAGYFHNSLTTKAFGFPDRGGIGAFSIPGFMRMFGFMSVGANSFGTYMLVPFGMSMYLVLKNKKLLNLFLSIFLFATIVLSMSRNAYIALFTFMLIVFIFYKLKDKVSYKLIFRTYFLIVSVFLCISALYLARNAKLYTSSTVWVSEKRAFATPLFLLERLNPFVSLSLSKSSRYFTDHLKIALIHCLDNFGFGLGPQNFNDYASKNYKVIGYSAHSNFIIFLGDTGIWGLLIQLMIVYYVIKYGITSFKNREYKNDYILLFLVAIFTGLVVAGIIRTYYLDTYTFLVSGLIVRLNLTNQKDRKIYYWGNKLVAQSKYS